MKKCYKDTLANLISGELHRLTLNWYKAVELGDEKAKEFWRSEIVKFIKYNTEVNSIQVNHFIIFLLKEVENYITDITAE